MPCPQLWPQHPQEVWERLIKIAEALWSSQPSRVSLAPVRLVSNTPSAAYLWSTRPPPSTREPWDFHAAAAAPGGLPGRRFRTRCDRSQTTAEQGKTRPTKGGDQEDRGRLSSAREHGKAAHSCVVLRVDGGFQLGADGDGCARSWGSLVSEFDASKLADAVPTELGPLSEETLWETLEYFLRQVIPVAERAGVRLAMHPDDPPLSPIRGSE